MKVIAKVNTKSVTEIADMEEVVVKIAVVDGVDKVDKY